MNSNIIGPLTTKRQPDDNWDEIIDGTQFYYLKKDTYRFVSSPPAPRPGWKWHEIGNDNYIVKIVDPK